MMLKVSNWKADTGLLFMGRVSKTTRVYWPDTAVATVLSQALRGRDGMEALFLDRNQKPFTDQSIAMIFNQLVYVAGLRPRSIHAVQRSLLCQTKA